MTPMPAKFTQGSTLRHVIEMTWTSSVGLIAIFFVDFLNLFYISRLAQPELTAAVGYVGTVFFFLISVCIGITIAGTALVARAVGAGDRALARRQAASAVVFIAIVAIGLSALAIPYAKTILALLGASGGAQEAGARFMVLSVPSVVFMAFGMILSSLLRAVGDAQRSMWVTLAGGLVLAVFDPLLIFGAGLGLDGAALASNIARLVMAGLGFYGAVRVHDIVARPSLAGLRADWRPLSGIAVPAVLTNIATPVGAGIVTAMISRYGDEAVAGWTIVGRIWPMAFVALFALSGAIGPIIGQNVGAKLPDRVRSTVTDSLLFVAVYGVAVWIILLVASPWITQLFGASGKSAALVWFFCAVVSLGWAFNGAQFTANAAFNNLGFPTYSTVFNWARTTIGTVPFAWAGERLLGVGREPEGILAGQAVGGIVFAVLSMVVCYRVIRNIQPVAIADDRGESTR